MRCFQSPMAVDDRLGEEGHTYYSPHCTISVGPPYGPLPPFYFHHGFHTDSFKVSTASLKQQPPWQRSVMDDESLLVFPFVMFDSGCSPIPPRTTTLPRFFHPTYPLGAFRTCTMTLTYVIIRETRPSMGNQWEQP